MATALNVTLVIFMVGSLLEVGLRIDFAKARRAIGNIRFLVLTVLVCFVLGPGLAVVLTKIIPLAPPYALGMIMLGMVPCSPANNLFVPKARASLEYLTVFMLLAFGGTVILMPIMVPWLATGFSADAWTIAKPLVLFIALPLILGATVRLVAKDFAEKSAPIVKLVTGIDTVVMVVIAVWMYRSEFLSTFGTYAIGTQILYYALAGAAAYALASGLPYEQKAVLTLGVATRNVGPALAPLFAVPGTDVGAIAMCILAYYDYPISTGPLEGTNTKIQAMKRQAYGFRDRDFYKLKILGIHETKHALVG